MSSIFFFFLFSSFFSLKIPFPVGRPACSVLKFCMRKLHLSLGSKLEVVFFLDLLFELDCFNGEGDGEGGVSQDIWS